MEECGKGEELVLDHVPMDAFERREKVSGIKAEVVAALKAEAAAERSGSKTLIDAAQFAVRDWIEILLRRFSNYAKSGTVAAGGGWEVISGMLVTARDTPDAAKRRGLVLQALKLAVRNAALDDLGGPSILRQERAEGGGGADVCPKGADAHRAQNDATGGASMDKRKRKKLGYRADWTQEDALTNINMALDAAGRKHISKRTMMRWSAEGSPVKSSAGAFPWWGNQDAVNRWCAYLDFPKNIKKQLGAVPYNDKVRKHTGLPNDADGDAP